MKCTSVALVAALCATLVHSLPVPEEQGLQSQVLDRLVMVEGAADNEEALRSKRTIGLLRQLFPGVSQIVEQKVSAITSEVIRILGPIVLRGVLGGGGGGGLGGGGGQSGGQSGGNSAGTIVTAKSPFDDDDGDDANGSDLSAVSRGGSKVSISLPTFPPDEAEDEEGEDTTTPGDVNPESENQVQEAAAESQNNEVRVQFTDDQEGAAANDNAAPDLPPLDDIDIVDENRNKRFLNFGLSGATGAQAAGGSGGSGNFLFDIIRQAADGAARAAGTVYRVVAGTQSLGLGLSASREVGPAPASAPAAAPAAPAAAAAPGAPAAAPAPAAPAPGGAPQPPVRQPRSLPALVAGSGSTEQADAANAAAPGRADGTQEAVPGPITRLFVIANRGISNLVQDLILRLAATSERIVNFKARLITSII
ncbi:AF4/FMR2 family member 4 [Orussus abietinus]|uniref:AF4/FMR2 family member 4 n=1 Tax=Orussus abietinus TaxID=222816 RepID=UPI000C715D0C|nr:AF4/FMR2 family member 4 [Orussus abietinus]